MSGAQEFAASATPGGDLREHVDALNVRAWAEHLTDARHALELAHEAWRLAAGDGYLAGQAASLRTRGVCLLKRSELDEARHDLQAALELFRALGDRTGEVAVLRWLGHLRARAGDVGGALRLRAEGLLLAREAGDREGEADTLLAMGLDHHQLGDYAEALRYGEAAREIKEALGDTPGLGACLNNLGNALYMLGEYDRALEHFRLALEFHEAAGANSGTIQSNMGSTYLALGRPGTALEHFACAVACLRDAEDHHGEVAALANLAEVRHMLGQRAEARELFETALMAARRLGHPYMEAGILRHLGEALAAEGDGTQAMRHLEAAARIAGEIGARQLVVDANRALARIHEDTGNVAEAFRCYKAYRELESEIFGQQADQRIRAVLVKAEVEKARHETELLRRKNDELERQTREDALTGVGNRRHLDAGLAAELERARRDGRELSVAMADVDRFKQVNDRFSHAVGDRVLRQVGTILRAGVRPTDMVARYGGEEFALVMVETPADEAAACCESLRAAVEAFDWDGIHQGLRVTVSIGIAFARGTADPAPLLAAADARLYAAKRGGRNRVCW